MRLHQTTLNHYSVVSRTLGCNPMYMASVVKHILLAHSVTLASLPGLSCLCVRSGKKRGRAGNTYHVINVRLIRGECREEGSTFKDIIIECPNDRQDSRRSQDEST